MTTTPDAEDPRKVMKRLEETVRRFAIEPRMDDEPAHFVLALQRLAEPDRAGAEKAR